MFGFLALVWLAQLANFADHYALSRDYGVVSGDIGTLPNILTAPFLHWNWAHIESNWDRCSSSDSSPPTGGWSASSG